jgi:hypothetical protein
MPKLLFNNYSEDNLHIILSKNHMIKFAQKSDLAEPPIGDLFREAEST